MRRGQHVFLLDYAACAAAEEHGCSPEARTVITCGTRSLVPMVRLPHNPILFRALKQTNEDRYSELHISSPYSCTCSNDFKSLVVQS